MSPQKGLVHGLPMFAADPQALAKEKAQLAELENKGILPRWKGYFAKSGPGWMQGAMTLGGGSAMASLFAGAFLQYKLLWIQPLAMILGIIMLSAISHQTLSTNARPFDAMKRFVHPALAWSWAIASLLATIIWHIPQYGLAAGMADDMIKAVTGWQPSSPAVQVAVLMAIGLVIMFTAIAISWNYAVGRKGIKVVENILKSMVWLIIIAFAIVVIRRSMDGGVEWKKVFKGFLPLELPTDKRGVAVAMAAFGAAVGINMTFLFPYSYLARGWGKEHRGLARFDLITGMLIPYVLATSLLVITAGCTIYNSGFFTSGSTRLTPMQAATMIQSAGLPMFFARIVFGLGIISMAMNAITMHMLVSGFAACELFGVEPGGWKYRLACLTPTPGVLGVILWKYMGPWIAVPASAVAGLMLPIAYIGFFILNNNSEYLGKDKPRGTKAAVWNIGMLLAIGVSLTSVGYYLYSVFSR